MAMMENTAVWIALSIIIAVFVIFLCFIYHVVKRPVMEAISEAQNDPKKHLKVTTPSWELVTDDEFGGPFRSRLLFAVVGSGVHSLTHTLVFLLASCPLCMALLESPKYEKAAALMSSILYCLLAPVAGFTGSLLTKTLKPSCMSSKDRIEVSSLITLLNCFYMRSLIESGTLIIKADYVIMSFVSWLCILLPITLLGGYVGRHAELIHLPILTNRTSQVITPSSVLTVAAGFVASLICCTAALNILESSWQQNPFLQSVILLIILSILEASVWSGGIVLMHMELSTGELRCRWWRAFLSFGVPVGLTQFFRSIILQFLLMGNRGGLALMTANLFCSLATGVENMLSKDTLGLVLTSVIYSLFARFGDTIDPTMNNPVEKP